MQNKKWISFLLALVLAIALWVYVVTYENQELAATIYNIPVVFVGEDVLRDDYDLLIDKDSLEAGVALTFYGKLSDIKKLQSDKSDIHVELNVSALIRSARNYSLNYDISDVKLPASVSATDISLTEQHPRTIDISVSNLARKSVEVRVSADLKMAENYLADSISQDHKEIIIEGPEHLVEQVDYALVALTRENVDQSISTVLGYTLMSKEGDVLDTDEITSDITQIEVNVPVVLTKEVNLVVDVLVGRGITEQDISYDISPKKIRLSGEKAVLDAIDSIRLDSIDLADLASNEAVLLRDVTIPTGCENLSNVEEATVTIEIHNKAIKTLRVPKTSFQYINVPEGMSAEAATEYLSVVIRANTRDIDQIKEENIRIVIDLSSVTVREGAFSVKIQDPDIYIDGFEGAGYIGTDYAVIVDLAPLEETEEDSGDE